MLSSRGLLCITLQSLDTDHQKSVNSDSSIFSLNIFLKKKKIKTATEKALESKDYICLEGCHIRKSELSGFKHCIEIYHVDHRMTSKFDYVYLICSTDKKLEKWWQALGKVLKPGSDELSAIKMRSLPDTDLHDHVPP